MSKKTYDQRAAEADRESRAVLKALRREQEREEALAQARQQLAAIHSADDLEHLTIPVVELKALDPDAFAAMRSRVIDHLPPAQKLHVKQMDMLARPAQPSRPEPPSTEALAAAVAAGTIDAATLGALTDEQVRSLKAGPGRDVYRRSIAALALDERPYSVVVR